MASSLRPLACFAALLLAAEPVPGAAAPAVPLVVAQGKEVVLPPGTVWKARFITDGVTVGGRLIARGTQEKPIVFTGPAGWRGITVTGDADLEHVVIERAENGIKVSGGSVSVGSSRIRACSTGISLDQSGRGDITGSTFEGNASAVVAGLRAQLTATRCLVKGSREVGILVSRQAEANITGSAFLDNAVAVRLWQKTGSTVLENLFQANRKGFVADQTEAGPTLKANIFATNATAVEVINGSALRIEGNIVMDSGTGVEVSQISSPEILGNTFVGNRTAASFLKRSRGRVGANLFEANSRGLFCDFSSYPSVAGNNFEGNAVAIALGENQSYDWETREGKHATPLPGQPTPASAMPGVDATGNWWGKATTGEMAAAGAHGDIGAIDDGFDHEPLTYDGYAGRSYAMDRVIYRPWLKEPVTDAGAPRDYLRGLEFPGTGNPLAGR